MKLIIEPTKFCFRLGQSDLDSLMKTKKLIENIPINSKQHLQYSVYLSEKETLLQLNFDNLSLSLIAPIEIIQHLIKYPSKEGHKQIFQVDGENITVLLQINLKSNS